MLSPSSGQKPTRSAAAGDAGGLRVKYFYIGEYPIITPLEGFTTDRTYR
jgi:hypothetical protein